MIKETKPSFPGLYMEPTVYDGTITSGIQPPKKYESNGKGWQFRFDDDNNMHYKCLNMIYKICVKPALINVLETINIEEINWRLIIILLLISRFRIQTRIQNPKYFGIWVQFKYPFYIATHERKLIHPFPIHL